MQESQSDSEDRTRDKAEDSPLLTEEDTSSEETKKLTLKTTTQPQVIVHCKCGALYMYVHVYVHCSCDGSNFRGFCRYCSVLGKRPLPGKHPCTAFQGAAVAASIQTYGILIQGKHPCGPKLRVIFKCPWALIQDTIVIN